MLTTIFSANYYLDMLQLDFWCFSRYAVILTNGYRIDIIFFFLFKTYRTSKINSLRDRTSICSEHYEIR